MLKWFSKRTPIKETGEEVPVVSPGNTQGSPVFLRNDEGFYLPLKADVLLASPQRKNWLQQISRVVALPDRQYRELCLVPLNRLAERLQCVPAVKKGKYAGEGGLLDLTLTTTAWAMKMSQKDMLPRGIPSEEQTRQFSAWNVCVFYTGLFHWLPLTAQLEGQLNNQSLWQPGVSTPTAPFRFRFREPAPDIVSVRQTAGALMAFQLLPEKAVQWLANYPRALQALTEVLTGQPDMNNDLLHVLNEALGAFEAGSLPEISAAKTVAPRDEDGNVSVPAEPLSPQISAPLPETPLPGAVPDNMVNFKLASPNEPEIQKAPKSTEVAVQTETLVSPDDDLQYALMLSGVPPSEQETVKGVENATEEPAVSADVVLMSVDGEVSDPEAEVKLGSGQLQPSLPAYSATVTTKHDFELEKEDKSCSVNAAVTVSTEISTDVLAADFIEWLRLSLSEKTLLLNVAGGPVHSIAGYLFLRSPHIFTLYLSQCPYEFERYIPVQRAFESLRLYRRNGKQLGGLVHCRLQHIALTEGERKLFWQKAAGYLVKIRKLLPGEDRDDSPYIEFE